MNRRNDETPPILLAKIEDYAKPKKRKVMGTLTPGHREEALIMVKALNDNVINRKGSLYKEFYYAEYNSNGKVTILVPVTGIHPVENNKNFISRIQSCEET